MPISGFNCVSHRGREITHSCSGAESFLLRIQARPSSTSVVTTVRPTKPHHQLHIQTEKQRRTPEAGTNYNLQGQRSGPLGPMAPQRETFCVHGQDSIFSNSLQIQDRAASKGGPRGSPCQVTWRHGRADPVGGECDRQLPNGCKGNAASVRQFSRAELNKQVAETKLRPNPENEVL